MCACGTASTTPFYQCKFASLHFKITIFTREFNPFCMWWATFTCKLIFQHVEKNNVTCEVGIFTGDFLHIFENFHMWNLHFYMFIWKLHFFPNWKGNMVHEIPWNLLPHVNPTFSCATGDFHKNIMCFVSGIFSSNWLFLARGLEFAHVETWYMKFSFLNVNSIFLHWLFSSVV